MSTTKKPTIPITGYEVQVQEMQLLLGQLKLIEPFITEKKNAFRKLAQDAAEQAASVGSVIAGGPVSVEFHDGVGGSVLVSLPDPAAAGNRKALSAETLATAAASGINLEGLLETVQSVTLTGATWVAWMEKLIAGWNASGTPMPPDGDVIYRSSTRLSAGGVETLRRTPGGATFVRSSGLSAPTVSRRGDK